jgi:hypothetical protein
MVTNPTNHHKIVSGETPEVGLRVFTNDWAWGTIVEVGPTTNTRYAGNGEDIGIEVPNACGPYCESWHKVRRDGQDAGQYTIYNCDRLTTRKPRL